MTDKLPPEPFSKGWLENEANLAETPYFCTACQRRVPGVNHVCWMARNTPIPVDYLLKRSKVALVKFWETIDEQCARPVANDRERMEHDA